MNRLAAFLHRLRRGHEPFWFCCCYDGIGWMWSCSTCDPHRVDVHPRTVHGWWR